jgi:lipoprotein-releasing system permease protein
VTVRWTPPLSWSLAWRFLRGRKSRLLNGTARTALISTALGVLAMIIAMALMTGYREDIQTKLIRGNAAIVLIPLADAEARLPAALRSVRADPDVTAVSPVSYGQGSLSRPGGRAVEVTLRGVTPGSAADFSNGAALKPAADGIPGIALGEDLAHSLQVHDNVLLRLAAIAFHDGRLRFHYRSVRVTGVYTTGFAEFDQSWVLIDRQTLESITGITVSGRLYEVVVRDPLHAGAVAERLRQRLGSEFVVSDWRELNRELFTALRLQQIALFFVLGLIVLVSTFNVASTLVVLVRERMREIGALAAMGYAPGPLRRVFLLYGIVLGSAGTLVGVLIGAAAAWLLGTFELIRFDPAVAAIYFVRAVPFHVELGDVAVIVAFTLAVTFFACWFPSRRAARVRPAEALRYE